MGQLGALIRQVSDGGGRLAVIAGPPGIGKTRLLAAACGQAEESGLTVLIGRAGQQERAIPFGVIREAFERAVSRRPVSERASLFDGAARLAAPLYENYFADEPVRAESPFAVVHGLYWLASNLSDVSPLLLAIDDLQWADEASLRFLAYLIPRLEDLPILLILTIRPGEFGSDEPVSEAIGAATSAMIELDPLRVEGTSAIVRDAYAEANHLDAEFCVAVHDATGGNPLLVRTLASSLTDEGIEPSAASVSQIGAVGLDRVGRLVLPRIHRLGADVVQLARAVTVLGPAGELRDAAALSQLSLRAASEAADRLRASGLLVYGPDVRFTHPLVSAAVREDVAPGARSELHRTAAALLRASGAPPERIAQHLLFADPAGDEATYSTLTEAARKSVQRGAPEVATAFFERALREPPPARRRAELLFDLGLVAFRARDGRAVDWLQQAVEAAVDPCLKAQIHLVLNHVTVIVQSKRPSFAPIVELISQVNREVALQIEAQLKLDDSFMAGDEAATLLRRVKHGRTPRGKTPAEREWLAAAALAAISDGAPADRAVLLAERALASGTLFTETGDSWAYFFTVVVLATAGRTDRAMELIEPAIDDSRRQGSLVAFEYTSCLRGLIRAIQGNLAEAEADLLGSLEVSSEYGWTVGHTARLAWLTSVLCERGAHEHAEQILASYSIGEGQAQPTLYGVWLLESRAYLRYVRGLPEAALADLERCASLLNAIGKPRNASVRWRITAAACHLMLGHHDEARRVALGQLELARAFNARPLLGASLRTLGLVEGGDDGIARLREAIWVLEDSPARLEQAWALVDLGAALRRSNRRAEAREPLRRGLDIADRCAATILSRRAREELLAIGARPRGPRFSGLEALTASERRVAEMAAGGLGNVDIAQRLFVTRKTVEKHLGNAYRKLDVKSRTDLPARLKD